MRIAMSVLASALAGCGGGASTVEETILPRHAYFPGDPTIRWVEFGASVEERAIFKAEFGSGDDVTLVIGGFHGSEPSSAYVALRLAEFLAYQPGALKAGKRVVLVPILNPDGFVRKERRNARGVDLNRNWPTENWGQRPPRREVYAGPEAASEPETKALMKLLETAPPGRIISIHAPLAQNNYDGPGGEKLARLMARFNRYPVTGYIGYPTPGSFGTWAGIERKIPMVTLEVDKREAAGGEFEKLWDENRAALMAVIND